jgi:hypothetical protein
MGLLHLLLRLVRARFFGFSVVTPHDYKSRHPLLRTPSSSHTNSHHPLPVLEKGERERDDFWGLESVASPSLSPCGGQRLGPL